MKNDNSTASASGDGKLKKIVIAEPLHSTGYLPLSRAEGFFEKRGLDVEVIQAAGGAHVTAVVSGMPGASSAGRSPMPWLTTTIPIRSFRS